MPEPHEQKAAVDELDREAEHLAHYAHDAHLAAEGAEALAHMADLRTHADAAKKLLKTHSQMAYDLRRMRQGIAKLQNVAKQGGARGAKAAESLPKAQEAYKLANLAFEKERPTVNAARGLLKEAQAVRAGVRGAAAAKVGQAVVKLEAALRGSAVGEKLLAVGSITTSKPFVRGLVVVGAAAEGVASYIDSTAETTTGKVANAALGAGSGALLMANPWVAGADVLAPQGYKPSEVYHGGAAAVTAIGEGLLKNDSKAMDNFHKRSMEGSYGKVLQAASEAGEFWAEKGVAGGLKEFTDALRWWLSDR
jgi:hypothetical protein